MQLRNSILAHQTTKGTTDCDERKRNTARNRSSEDQGKEEVVCKEPKNEREEVGDIVAWAFKQGVIAIGECIKRKKRLEC